MEELAAVYNVAMEAIEAMERRAEQQERTMRAILWGSESNGDKENINGSQAESRNVTPSSKRPKHLSALEENDDENVSNVRRSKMTKSPNALMPPPAVPLADATSNQSFSRPQRAAKLNCEKHLKEQPIKGKMRRNAENEVEIKLEHEQRASQAHQSERSHKKNLSKTKSNISVASTASHDSVIVIPNKAPSIVTVVDQSDQSSAELEKSATNDNTESAVQVTRSLSVRIKREKLSVVSNLNHENDKSKQNAQKDTTTIVESSVFSTTSTIITNNTTNDTTQTKKGQRKKKAAMPLPIKIERTSDAASNHLSPPVAARTRSASSERNKSKSDQEIEKSTTDQNATVYEEAVENQQQLTEKVTETAKAMDLPVVNNETIIIAQQKAASNITIAQQKSDSISGAGTGATNSTTPSNTTMVLGVGSAPNDATYCMAAAATFVVETQNRTAVGVACSDLTFDVASVSKDDTESQRSSNQSMATARDTLQPRAESLITEDESDLETPVANKPGAAPLKSQQKLNTLPFSASKKAALLQAKGCKMPVREIFNPLIQSPVKKKIEAYESVAAASKTARPARSRLAKENVKAMSTSTSTTPLIGKAATTSASTNSRYMTPTQPVNLITPNAMGAIKKMPASASKALGLTKSNSADKIWTTASAKAPSREHSAEDFRRGTQQHLAEERKKQREQKHLLAAQQREAKERERAERLAKAAKEREEKRLQKQQQAEKKQKELLEIQKKLKQQEEALAAAAAAEVAAQKAKLAKIQSAAGSSAKTRMLPPQPKSKYTFEMLHEDDSTDDEGKVTYKRPPPPNWSLSHVRGPAILSQEHMPTEPVDFFFSVQPRTLDLKLIFPKIDPRYLKRNSSAIWQTPPRYSELPKY